MCVWGGGGGWFLQVMNNKFQEDHGDLEKKNKKRMTSKSKENQRGRLAGPNMKRGSA